MASKIPKAVTRAMNKIDATIDREKAEEAATKAIEAWKKAKTRETQRKALEAFAEAKRLGVTGLRMPPGLVSLR